MAAAIMAKAALVEAILAAQEEEMPIAAVTWAEPLIHVVAAGAVAAAMAGTQ